MKVRYLFKSGDNEVGSAVDGSGINAFGTVENPVAMMMDEHSVEGERFAKIEDLSNRYMPPADATA